MNWWDVYPGYDVFFSVYPLAKLKPFAAFRNPKRSSSKPDLISGPTSRMGWTADCKFDNRIELSIDGAGCEKFALLKRSMGRVPTQWNEYSETTPDSWSADFEISHIVLSSCPPMWFIHQSSDDSKGFIEMRWTVSEIWQIGT